MLISNKKHPSQAGLRECGWHRAIPSSTFAAAAAAGTQLLRSSPGQGWGEDIEEDAL